MCGHRLRPKQGLTRLASKESRFQESREARIKMRATHVDAFGIVFRYRGASPLASTKIRPKTRYSCGFENFPEQIFNGFLTVFLFIVRKIQKKEGHQAFIAATNFFVPTILIALFKLYARKLSPSSPVVFSIPLHKR